MNRVAIFGTGLLGLLFLIGVTLGDPQDASDNVGPPDEPAAVIAAPDADTVEEGTDRQAETIMPTRTVDQNLDSRARAVRIDKDGFVFGCIHYVDPHTLEQVPVPGAVVTFMQACQIVTQAKSGADGRFTVKGLTPYATYSMFVRADLWVCMLGTYILPEDGGEVPVDDTAAANKQANTFLFASQPQVAEVTNHVQSAEGNPRFHAIQVVPLADFICAINQGLFGDIYGASRSGGACCPLPVGGAGGGGGAGYGGAAAAAFAAAAAAWGGGTGNDDNELASPFRP